jgi:predicted AAA+ superfamily ATPase
MIRQSLRETPYEGVLYYACDLDTDPDVIRQAVQTAKRLRPQSRRWRIFLDEVSAIPRWPQAVKWLRDNTPAREDTFILTGSSAIEVAAGADRLPGRRGRVARPDRILLPLSFADFARLHGVAPPVEMAVSAYLDPAAQREIEPMLLHQPQLQGLLERYMRVGGFPAAVIDEHVSGRVAESTVRMLWEMIEGEAQRHRRDPVRLFRTLEHIVTSLSGPTEWTALGEAIDADRRTAEEYVRLLARMFLVVVLFRRDPRRGGPQLGAQKKLYLVDPLLAAVPARIRQARTEPNIPGLVESVVLTALFRSEERPLAEEFAVPRALFYWRSKAGGEVDALVGAGRETIPVEVKYRAQVRGRDLAPLARSFPRGIVVTRDALDLSNPRFPRVPAAMFLWLLGGEHALASATKP